MESPFRAHNKWYQCEKGHLLCDFCWNDVRGKVSCYVCTTPMVPTIRCRELELIAGLVLDSAHEARDSDETALVGEVAESRAEASGYLGGGKESVLVETAAVGVTAPAEQMAPALGRDEATVPRGASAAGGDELDAEQSVPPPAGGSLPAGGSVSRELEERDDSRHTEAKEALAKRVKAAIESGDQNLLFATDEDGATFLHEAARNGRVDSE